jgi:N-acetylneuraminic acid mutarotase
MIRQRFFYVDTDCGFASLRHRTIMKTKTFSFGLGLVILCVCGVCRTQAQTTGLWTWESGGNTPNNPAVYGTLGVPASTNVIGARYGASGGELNGYSLFWLFGGTNTTGGFLNDLWFYFPGNGDWEWIKGPTTANGAGVYGTKGVPAVGNVPGARTEQSGWADAAGNIWIYGGFGYDATGNLGYLNDLWEFNNTDLAWIWVSGSSTASPTGVYGTQGTAAPGNAPGGRYYQSGWMDASGNFWIFGGLGLAASTAGGLNDLWKYNPTTGLWTWVSGSNSANSPGSYGTQGVAAASNMAPARYAQGGAADQSGNFWVYGGRGTGGLMNDLWKYSTSTGLWTWVSGSASANAAGVYGSQGVGAASNVPGARITSIWVDASGDIWLFGGSGYDGSGNDNNLNDVWEYNPNIGQWTWVDGSNTVNSAGSYGTKGTATTSNQPPARQLYASWVDSAGNFWVMGGVNNAAGNNLYNDVWEYNTISVLSLQGLNLQGASRGNENSLTWQTMGEMNTARFVVQRSKDGIDFSDIGNVTAMGNGNNSYSFVDASPPAGVTALYRIEAENQEGNLNYSNVVSIARAAAGAGSVLVFPNPATTGVTLEMANAKLLNTVARLIDVNGRVVGQQLITGQQQYFDLHQLAADVYFMQLADGTTYKIVKKNGL